MIKSEDVLPLHGKLFQNIAGIIAIIFHMFGVYVITYHSPKAMHPYKYILLASLISAFFLDMFLTVLAIPAPIPNSSGVQIQGFLADLMPNQGGLLVIFTMSSFFFDISTMSFGFIYREHALLDEYDKIHHKILRGFQIFCLIFFPCIYSPGYFYYDHVPDAIAREYIKNEIQTEIFPGAAIFLFDEEKKFLGPYVSIITIIFLLFFFYSMLRSINRITSFLEERKHHMSSVAIRTHKMLLRALIWQSIIPSCFLFLPFLLLIVFLRANEQLKLTDKPDSLYIVLLVLLSCFSPAHVISMTYFTVPYRNFCLTLLGMKKPPSVSPVVSSVSSHSRYNSIRTI